MTDLLRRYGTTLTGAFVVPTAFWLMALVILPNLGLFESAFRPHRLLAEVGGPRDGHSLDNYRKCLANPFDPAIPGIPVRLPIRAIIFLNTVIRSANATFVTLVIRYPLAHYLAKVAHPRTLPALLLLSVPLRVSEALRAFAWYIILTCAGPLYALLAGIGLLGAPVRWQNGVLTPRDAIAIGLAGTDAVFLLFPICGAIPSLDRNQIEAAADLGARWRQIHRRVVLPHARPGIASGGGR